MSPQFSVIMPLYNKAPYVRKALESVVSQTFKDWELIIVDDGSTDNSAAVCEEVITNVKCQMTNIRLIKQTNAGVAAARNNGVAASHGQFLCFLDADDWWEPTFLEEVDILIDEYPDAGLYATNYVYYKPGKTRVALNLPRGYMNYPDAYLHSDMMPVTSITTCMPRRVFDEMGGFPKGIKLGEDFLLWAKTALHYPVAFCDKPLAYYNNDVPASLRATRNLHAPQFHKLFNLAELESAISQLSDEKQKDLWRALLDKHRVQELFEYWLSDEYHNVAELELEKVDWGKQPKKVRRLYKTPIGVLKVHRRFMQIGSFWKQKIILLLRGII